MGSEKPSTDIANFSDSYTALANEFRKTNIGPLDASFDEINKKLLAAVSREIQDATSEIKNTAGNGFQLSKAVALDINALPDAITQDITSMPQLLGLERFKDIDSRIKQLLNSFHEVVQNPSAIFPCIACVEVPVDPTLISSFRKRYIKLERQHQEDPVLTETKRSMPTAPKSALDVITNITSSLESFCDDVLASTQALTDLSAEVAKLRDLVPGLRATAGPVIEIFEKEEAIHATVSRIESMFQREGECQSADAHYIDKQQNPNPLDIAKDAFSMLEKMKRTSDELIGSITKLEGASTFFEALNTDLREFFSVAVRRLSSLVDTSQKLKANLPRIGRELRQFFIPSGLKALLLKPSQTLVSILDNLEDIKGSLSEPETFARTTIDEVKKGECAVKVEAVKKRFDQLQQIPDELLSVIDKQDIQQIIINTLEKALPEVTKEISTSVLQGAASNMLEVVGAVDLASHVTESLSLLTGDSGNKKEGASKNSAWGDGIISLPWVAGKIFQ